MTKRLQPIRLDAYKPLREVVSETLRQAIQDGVLKPGERLMEIPLAEELGVSRTPIREAIRKLELEGFVVMVPRRGTYVANSRTHYRRGNRNAGENACRNRRSYGKQKYGIRCGCGRRIPRSPLPRIS